LFCDGDVTCVMLVIIRWVNKIAKSDS